MTFLLPECFVFPDHPGYSQLDNRDHKIHFPKTVLTSKDKSLYTFYLPCVYALEPYFEENFSNGSAGGNAYILMGDDKHIISFMTCEKIPTECDRFRWYVTNLFVRKNMESDKTAKRAIDLFSEEISENESLSINVNSEFKEIISFWRESGFKISPDRSVFQNADNEILIALTKEITGLSS